MYTDPRFAAALISIHALREEGDGASPRRRARRKISIHALREEGDEGAPFRALPLLLFLSTPSARRATWSPRLSPGRPWHFYPRPPRGGRRQNSGGRIRLGSISIHALREEGDRHLRHQGRPGCRFLSTPSARRATCCSLRSASEGAGFLSTPSARRATIKTEKFILGRIIFLSTPSARRATAD